MHRVFVALFCIILVISINGASLKLSTSIDKDAIELAQLVEEFWSLKPTILQRTKPLVYCEIIDRCCENEDRSEVISLLGQYSDVKVKSRLAGLIETCTGSADQFCSSSRKSIFPTWIAYQLPSVKLYFNITDKYSEELSNLFDRIVSTCNGEEVHALLCSANKNLVETCVGKIIQGLNDNDGYTAYQRFLMESKQAMIDLNQQLSQVFTKNTNIE